MDSSFIFAIAIFCLGFILIDKVPVWFKLNKKLALVVKIIGILLVAIALWNAPE